MQRPEILDHHVKSEPILFKNLKLLGQLRVHVKFGSIKHNKAQKRKTLGYISFKIESHPHSLFVNMIAYAKELKTIAGSYVKSARCTHEERFVH
jgi:hypothetical protein